MGKKITIIITIIVILLIGGYFLFRGNNQSASLQENLPAQTEENQQINPSFEPNPVQTAGNYEVTYTDAGYSPKELKIKLGDTVTWKNQSSHGMWTASAMHPTHVIYSGTSLDEHCPDIENTSLDQCTSGLPGESWSFTFNEVGTWRYHNHVLASDFGSVVVE